MRTIWKYEIPVTDQVEVRVPAGALILPFAHAADPTTIWLWADVDTAQPLTTRTIVVIGTGNPIDPEVWGHLSYLSSVVAPPFVWHVHELDTEGLAEEAKE